MKDIPEQLKGVWLHLAEILEDRRLLQIKSIKRMREAVKRTSQLTHAIEEGIVVLESDLRLSWWNQAAKAQLGLNASDRRHLLTSLIRDKAFTEYLRRKIQGRLELPSRVNPENG